MDFEKRFARFDALYLYGATPAADAALELLTRLNKRILAFVDRDPAKQAQPFLGYPVISPATLIQKGDTNAAVVIVSAHQIDIARFLQQNGVGPDRIFPHLDGMFFPTYRSDYNTCPVLDQLYSQLHSEEERVFLSSWRDFKQSGDLQSLRPMASMCQQYEHQGWLASIQPGGTALDIGAFDGASSIAFAHSRRFSKVIAIEPFRENYDLLVENITGADTDVPIEASHMAIGASRRSIWQASEGVSSRASLEGDSACTETGEKIEIYALDDLHFEGLSMIKVDIEGFELDFLSGAIKTLKLHRPHLAISAYHHHSHARKIAQFLYGQFDGVQIRVGHHPLAVYELEYYVSFND